MFKFIVFLLISAVTLTSYAQATTWQTLAPGVEYTKIPVSRVSNHGNLHAFRIDLNRYNLDLIFASDLKYSASSVRQLGMKLNVPLIINGGFFSPQHEPLGLRVKQGEERTPLKNTSWWGVFFVRNNKAQIVSQQQYRHRYANHSHIDFAIQAGPRLVVDEKIPKLKDGFAERSALGVTQEGKVIIAATQNAPITTTQLAQIMSRPEAEGGLGTPNALNLDGGKSSQLYAKFDRFSLNIPNFSVVTDAIVIKPK